MTDLLQHAAERHVLSLGMASGTRDRRHWLARTRYQLLGATLFAVALPAALRSSGLDGLLVDSTSLANSIIGTFLAMLVGTYFIRRVTAYPGVNTVTALIPVFSATYGTTIVVFFFTRLDYSRFQFVASFALVLGWFGIIGLVEPHIRRARLLLLPFGKAGRLLQRKEADWVVACSHTELSGDVTAVVADLNADLSPGWQRLLADAALSGRPVYHWKQISEALSGTVDIEHISENNLGSLLPSSVYLRFKRVVDIAIVMVTLPVSAAVGLATAMAVLICDGRPVLFKQRRTGFRGRPFTMLKFRTMCREAGDGRAFTAANDPRVTRLGRWLRRYRIDELPQIINILAGEMSWIGPRPESLELAGWYESEVPFYSYRHIVRPGITGWAQVHQGNVAEIKAATGKLRFDFYYIKHFSPWLDLLVAAKTVRTLLTGFGAR